MVVVKAGVLDGDGPDKLAPMAEVFTSRKPGWVKCVDGAMQFDKAFPVFDEMTKGAQAAMEVRMCLQYLIWLMLNDIRITKQNKRWCVGHLLGSKSVELLILLHVSEKV